MTDMCHYVETGAKVRDAIADWDENRKIQVVRSISVPKRSGKTNQLMNFIRQCVNSGETHDICVVMVNRVQKTQMLGYIENGLASKNPTVSLVGSWISTGNVYILVTHKQTRRYHDMHFDIVLAEGGTAQDFREYIEPFGTFNYICKWIPSSRCKFILHLY